MGIVSTRVDANGFWYLIDFRDHESFSFGYIAVGSAGRFVSGEVSGSLLEKSGWQRVDLGFPVLHVGVTDIEIGTAPSSESPAGQDVPKKSDTQRRSALIALASTTLTGGLLVSRSGVALPDLLSVRDGRISSTVNVHGTMDAPDRVVTAFNPY
jgi:hypothetical protein